MRRAATGLVGGLLLGAAIAAIPVLLWDAPWETAFRAGRPWWALAGLGLGIVAPVAAGAGLAAGAPVAVVLLRGFAGLGWSGPDGIGAAFASSAVPSLLGVAAGVLLGRLVDRVASGLGRDELSGRYRKRLARIVTTVAVAATLLTAVEEAGATAAREASARGRTVDVWRAQRTSLAERGAYACGLDQLPIGLGGERPETNGGRRVVERGGYRFSLRCPPDGTPGFRLRAEPGWLPSRKPAGRWAYCVDERGELRRIPWAHRDDPCLLGGEVVARLGGH